MVLGSGHSRKMASMNTMDPDSWSGTEEAVDGGGRTTMSNIQLTFHRDIPKQLVSTCCYGRGKRLEDIVIPRLPKVLQDGLDSVVDSSSLGKNWQSALQSHGVDTQYQRPMRRIHAAGRGKVLEDHPMIEQVKIPDSVPARASPASSVPAVYQTNEHQPILIDGYSECEVRCVRPPQKTGFNVKCSEDFPSLSANRVVNGSLLDTHKMKSGPGRETPVEISLDVFEDTDGMSTLQSDQSIGDVRSHSSQTQTRSTSLVHGCYAADISKKHSRAIDDADGGKESISLLSLNSETDLDTATGEDLTSQSIHTLEATMSHAEDGTAEAGACSPVNVIRSPKTKKTGSPKAKSALKTKKKSGWKLEGPLVVHMENVPNGCGSQLNKYVTNFGTIVDSEKKSRKGKSNAWRFRFEDRQICEYVVHCFDGNNIFDDTYTELECYCVEAEDKSP